jgi:hypothetical protein
LAISMFSGDLNRPPSRFSSVLRPGVFDLLDQVRALRCHPSGMGFLRGRVRWCHPRSAGSTPGYRLESLRLPVFNCGLSVRPRIIHRIILRFPGFLCGCRAPAPNIRGATLGPAHPWSTRDWRGDIAE